VYFGVLKSGNGSSSLIEQFFFLVSLSITAILFFFDNCNGNAVTFFFDNGNKFYFYHYFAHDRTLYDWTRDVKNNGIFDEIT